jgi:hypothetical protein
VAEDRPARLPGLSRQVLPTWVERAISYGKMYKPTGWPQKMPWASVHRGEVLAWPLPCMTLDLTKVSSCVVLLMSVRDQ